MNGKICLVTGGTSGIGKAAALALAQMGATVVVVARDRAKGEATVAEIKAGGRGKADLLIADLASQASVRQLAAAFKVKYHRLDVLINNAGAAIVKRQQTVDGLEMTFALNHLAPFLLTNLLLDTLKASTPARVVTVSSSAQATGEIDFADLQGTQRYSGFKAYRQSKLANVLFTYELARRLEGTGVTANCLHPGVIASGFGRNNGRIFKLLAVAFSPFLLTPEKGAETTIYLASSPQVEGVTGKYFIKKAPAQSSSSSYNPEIARRLWEVSVQMTGLEAKTGV